MALEAEVDDLSDALFNFCKFDERDPSSSLDELKTQCNQLRFTHGKYRDAVFELLDLKSQLGRTQERKDLTENYDAMNSKYKIMMKKLRFLRESAGDDNISVVSSAVTPPDNPVNPQDMCSFFVEHQSMNATSQSLTDFLTPPEEMNPAIVSPHSLLSNTPTKSIPSPSGPTNASYNNSYVPSVPVVSNNTPYSSTPKVHFEAISELGTNFVHPPSAPNLTDVIYTNDGGMHHNGRQVSVPYSASSTWSSKSVAPPSIPSYSVRQYYPQSLEPVPCQNFALPSVSPRIAPQRRSYSSEVFASRCPEFQAVSSHSDHLLGTVQSYGAAPPSLSSLRIRSEAQERFENNPNLRYSTSGEPQLSAPAQPPQHRSASQPTDVRDPRGVTEYGSRMSTPLSLSSHFNPLLPINNITAPAMQQDLAARILIKQTLMSKKDHGDTYKGEAVKFYGFIHKFRSKIRNLGLDAYEIIEILGAYCEGRPKRIVDHYEYSAFRDGEEALDAIWKDLYSNFGQPRHVRAEIKIMIRKIGSITSREDVEQLKDLLQICQLISINMRYEVGSLVTFDTEDGQSEIFNLFPHTMFNKWRIIVKNSDGRYPKFDRLVSFIKDVIEEVQSLDYQGSSKKLVAKSYYVSSERQHTSEEVINQPKRDKFCVRHKTNTHDLFECNDFLKESSKDKIEYVHSKNLCFKCFQPHFRKTCMYNPCCQKCDGYHQTSLHDSEAVQNYLARVGKASFKHSAGSRYNHPSTSEPWRSETSARVNSSETSLWGSCSDQSSCSYSKVLLVDISSISSNKSVRCYAILDEQSSRTFITPALADELRVDGTDIDYSLNTMNGLRSHATGKEITGLRIRGYNEIKSYALPPVVTNEFIPNCIEEAATPEIVRTYPQVKRFSKFFNPVDSSAEVMILIGRDGNDLMKTECLNESAPFVHKTSLGYALVGCGHQTKSAPNFTVLRTAEHFDMVQNVPQNKNSCLFNKDVLDSSVRLHDDEMQGDSQDDLKFDAIMLERTHIAKSRHITMPLPFRNSNQLMPDNRKAVFMRTKNTLNRLMLDKVKLNKCCQVMESYINANHVETVPWAEQDPNTGKGWWLPIFPVTQAKKDKTRIVFDSSASYKGISLNEVLLQGPDRNNSLRGVLVRFRNGTIAVSSDIESMFHSFNLSESDRDFVRFFWFKDNDPKLPLVQYRARVQIFGNKPSPAIANHGLRCAINFPSENDCSELSKIFVTRDIYVDDALAAFDSTEEATNVLKGAKDKLAQFNIRLHKISSNSKEVVSHFPCSELAKGYSEDKEIVSGALGLLWNIDHDKFQFKIDLPSKNFTPRGVLSINHSIFDPLGLLSPVIFQGRILQREMFDARQGCKKGVAVNWDEPLRSEYLNQWLAYIDSLSEINSVSFPRSYYPEALVPVSKQELHVFSDASFHGLGYTIYIRSFGNGKVYSSLVFAGSKVAPKAATSIPRLELNAAVEASAAALKMQEALGVGPANTFYHCDSQVVLGYLVNSEKRFTRYVCRRIELIQNMSCGKRWNYVQSDKNPADLASRPQSVDILSSPMWLHGPEFLSNIEYDASNMRPEQTITDLPEEKVLITCCNNKKVKDLNVFSHAVERSSILSRLLGVVRKVLSLLNCLDRARQRLGVSLAPRAPLDQMSKEKALSILIKDCQLGNDFGKMSNFSPFLDVDGMWRVGGRLKHAFIPFDGKHPLIVTKSSGLARLLVEHFHRQVKHQGRTITHSATRSAGFFIPGARSLVSSVIKSCAICQRLRGKPCVPEMSDLPPDRLEESPPFTYTGLDMFGPHAVTEGITTRRNSATKKVWGLVFICLVTRAVHVETVPGLDTSSMINALRRFFAIRGVCRHLRSDNGSNFVAACNEIGAEKCIGYLRGEAESHDCKWIFNPPGASHMGGSWERAIGSIRKIMAASLLLLGNRAISRDEIHTLFQEAVSIINNTPLYETSNSPDEPLSISPANLLMLKDSPNPSPVVKFSESDINSYGLKRWKRIQIIADEFWKRWRKDYLATLQSRSKWSKSRPNLCCGDVVIIKDKQLPRNNWPTGVIEKAFHSDDGNVRSCEVRTSQGMYRRAVCDLVLLSPAESRVSRPRRDYNLS